MARVAPISVVETPEFIQAATKLLSEREHSDLIDFLARNPAAGDLIPGTGGVRKLRWGLEGRGKRGGARVIYFYHDVDMPIIVLTAYAKNQRDDLSQQDRNEMKRLTVLLVGAFKRRSL